MAVQRVTLAVAVAALAGCAAEPRMVRVEVPVAIDRKPPEGLLEPAERPPVLWLAPGAPGAAVCLPEGGVRALRGYIVDLEGRDEIWRSWAL